MFDNWFLGDLFSYGVPIIIGVFVTYFLARRKKRRDAQMPPRDVADNHIEQLRKMKEHGAGYYEQLNYLQESGLPKHVSEKIVLMATKDQME